MDMFGLDLTDIGLICILYVHKLIQLPRVGTDAIFFFLISLASLPYLSNFITLDKGIQ